MNFSFAIVILIWFLGFVAPANAVELGVRLPPPISTKQLDRYSAMLMLSEAQRLFFQQLHEQYLEKADQLLSKELAELKALSAQGGAASIEWRMSDAAEIGNKLALKEVAIVEKFKEWEGELFLKLQTVLGESQLPFLQRVQNKRQREMLILHDCYMVGAKIDLGVFAEQMFDSTRLARADAVLAEYETAVTPLMAKLDKLMFRGRTEGRYLDAELYNARTDPRPEGRIAAVDQAYEKFLPDASRLQHRIADINDEFLLRIAAPLGNDDGPAMIHAYRMAVYGWFYPDPLWSDSLYEAVAKSPSLNDDHRRALVSAYHDYGAHREDVWKKMASVIKDREESRSATRQFRPDKDYVESMRKLRLERWKTDQQFVETMKTLLPADVVVEFQSQFDGYRQKALATIEESERDNFPPR